MMKFKKKETLVQNITYMGLMAAINVVFVLLTTFVPILFVLIVFVLPLTSTVVALHCEKKYFPIYALATIALCLLCTIWKIDDTIFYVVPSIITGFVFAILVEKGLSAPWIILATIIIQVIFTYLSIPLINVLTGRSIVETFAVAFGVKDFPYLDYVVPCFIFTMAFLQSVLSFIIINEEIKKFGFELSPTNFNSFLFSTGIGVCVTFAVIFALTYRPLSLVFVLAIIYFGVLLMVGLINEKKIWIYISLIGSFILSFFLFAIIYQHMPAPLGFLLVGIYFVFVGIISIVNNCLVNHANKV